MYVVPPYVTLKFVQVVFLSDTENSKTWSSANWVQLEHPPPITENVGKVNVGSVTTSNASMLIGVCDCPLHALTVGATAWMFFHDEGPHLFVTEHTPFNPVFVSS